ncbi:hypothetical protein BVRB_019740, partial [Beta vulgaris subsp. vulgaris]
MMCSLRHDNQRNCHRYRPTRSLQCLTQSSLLLQSIVNPDSPELAATKQANLSDLIRHFPDDITAGLRLAVRVAQAEEPVRIHLCCRADAPNSSTKGFLYSEIE